MGNLGSDNWLKWPQIYTSPLKTTAWEAKGKGEGRIFSCLSIIANLFFIEFQKRHKVTEVVIFVSIHQGENQWLNHHCLCHCLTRKAQ